LLEKQQSIHKDLKANRDARISRIENSKGTWADMLKALDDIAHRTRVGDEMAVMNLAKEKAKDNLSEWHTFEDGKVDQPFLTPETVKSEDE
jgi:hypothetical protein